MGNAVSAYSVIWIVVLVIFVVLFVFRCARRQQYYANAQRQYAVNNPPSVQMIGLQSSSPLAVPPGFTPVLVNGQVVFQPLYSAQSSYPPPAYQSYPGGTFAQAPVAAIPLAYHSGFDQGQAYRLSDERGGSPPAAPRSPTAPLEPPAAAASPVSSRSSSSARSPSAPNPPPSQVHYHGETDTQE